MARRLARPNDVRLALQVSAYLYLMLRDPARVAEAAWIVTSIPLSTALPLSGSRRAESVMTLTSA